MTDIIRSVYRHTELQRLLQPASVALVGASANAASLGGRTLANLAAFPGRLYPVNARHAELGGRTCYPSITALPEAPDCVVLAVPQEAVEAVAVECAQRGAGAVIVLASGYAETGLLEDAAAQQRLLDIGMAHGMRVVGPNCVGVANRAHGLHAAFAEFPPSALIPGTRIGLVAQSGALGLGLSHAAESGSSISHVLTCGNSCDVDVADYVAFLAEDAGCDAIALVFEGLPDPARLLAAARLAAARGKRIAACKLGMSEAGRAAARYHTHTATGDPAAWPDLFRQAGIVQVARIESLLETAAFLAKAPASGPLAGADGAAVGAAIVSGSGGTAILATDAASRHGVPVPQPAEHTAARLRAALPPFGSPRNPCDATAQATRNPESLLECADAMLADPQYGSLVIPWGRSQPVRLMAQLGELSARHGKPVCIVWMSQRREGPGAEEAEKNPRLALFRSLDACFDALAQWQRLGTAAQA